MTGKTDSSPGQSTVEASSAALQAADVDLWLDYLEKIEVSDQLAFIQTQGALHLNGLRSSPQSGSTSHGSAQTMICSIWSVTTNCRSRNAWDGPLSCDGASA